MAYACWRGQIPGGTETNGRGLGRFVETSMPNVVRCNKFFAASDASIIPLPADSPVIALYLAPRVDAGLDGLMRLADAV